jgi:uncharacterized protein
MMKSLGLGLGLRAAHYDDVLALDPRESAVKWFEVITENFFGLDGYGPGQPLEKLLRVREKFPIVLHGVSLSIGSTDPLDKKYLHKWRELIRKVEPAWVSDHICWTSRGGQHMHDLLPMPYTMESIQHLAARIEKVQEFLGRKILLENVSSYLEYKASEMTEWEFLRELVKRAGCGLLLDINNIFVSSVNHGFSAKAYIDAIPPESVGQYHLAGHAIQDNCLIDTHDNHVRKEVWELYSYAVKRIGVRSTMIEWDNNIPSFATLVKEVEKAKKYWLTPKSAPLFEAQP